VGPAVTAPIDRAFVEILPTMAKFSGKVKEGVHESVGEASKEAEGFTKKFKETTEGLGERTAGIFERMRDSAKELFITLAPMAAGFGLVEFIKESTSAAADQNREMRLIAQGIKSTGGAAHVTAQDIDELTTRLSEQSGISKTLITTRTLVEHRSMIV